MEHAARNKLAIAACAAVLAAAGGIAVAQGDDGASVAASAPTARTGVGMPPGGGPDVSALAEDLGVSTSALERAMRAARPTAGRPDPSQMAAELADALDLPSASVQQALDANRPDGGPPQPAS